MAETPSLKRDFEPDGIPTTTSSSEAQAPALSSSKALARFEFEPGRSNEATKILMVEWEDDTESGTSSGDWEVSWDGKKTTLSTRDGAEGSLHRIYFLLGPGVSIPPVVKLAQAGGKAIQTNPLPAIFPAELGASATAAGKLGVLHTVWAKKRLSVLQKEIELEMKTNGEGIGLEMAMQEKQWIEDNFGVGSRAVPEPPHPTSPTSPKTPGGGRLSEKLKGLKLGTSASALSAPLIAQEPSGPGNSSLSPDLGDVAVSSFALFHSASARPPAARAIAQNPPGYLVARQADSRGGSRINSLDAVASGDAPAKEDNDIEEGLFAVRLSPRSPEMTKSPFSFAAKDTAPWKNDNE